MLHLHRRSDSPESEPPATRGRLIRWARYYDPFVSVFTLGRRAQLRRRTVALANIRPGDRVLEVGCGTGDVALAAKAQAGAAGEVCGIDPSPEMIAVARAKAERAAVTLDFRLGRIEALPFADASFDVVLSSLMMHHLPDDLKREGLANIARVLKPGGRLLIVDFKRRPGRRGRVLSTLLFHGRMETDIQDLLPMLRAVGFTGIEEGEVGFMTLGFVRGQTRT